MPARAGESIVSYKSEEYDWELDETFLHSPPLMMMDAHGLAHLCKEPVSRATDTDSISHHLINADAMDMFRSHGEDATELACTLKFTTQDGTTAKDDAKGLHTSTHTCPSSPARLDAHSRGKGSKFKEICPSSEGCSPRPHKRRWLPFSTSKVHDRGNSDIETDSDVATATAHGSFIISGRAGPAKDATNFGDLFFDLLFAANLEVYTEAVSLNNPREVGGFLGWFVVLWWTWFSHSLYDVRYRHMRGDSTHALNRNPQLLYTPLQDSRSLVPLLYAQLISRLAQIGLWVCFMTTASNFGRGSYGSFSMIYGLNRFSLAADWGVVLLWKVWWEWNERKKERKARQEEHRAEENEQQSAETLESSTDATTHAQQSSDLSSPDPYTAQDDREVERTAPSEKPSPLPHGISKRGELISMISALISSGIWLASSYLPRLSLVHRLGMWLAAIFMETVVLVWVEASSALSTHHLGQTPICERLALFALVILGQGFVSLGQLLNSLSPGLKIPSHENPSRQVAQGGWDGIVVVNTCSAVLIICCAFVTYYRDAETEIRRKTVKSLTILGWSGVHVLYFASAALLVVGLKRLLALQSVVSAFTRLIIYPHDYLPNTEEYANLTSLSIEKLIYNFTRVAAEDHHRTLLNMDLDTPEAGVLAMVSVIEGFEGASIPSVDLARALVRSALAFDSNEGENLLDSNAALRVQLHHYSEYLETLSEPTSIRRIILQGLFQFKYVYLAVALIYGCDVVIKGVLDGWTEIKQTKWPSLIIRLSMACVLCGVQVVYLHFKSLPSWTALAGGLPILALLMVIEIILQAIVEWVRWAVAERSKRRTTSR